MGEASGRVARGHGGGGLDAERLARAWHEANQDRQLAQAERWRVAGRLMAAGFVPQRRVSWEDLGPLGQRELLEQATATVWHYGQLEPGVSFEELQAWCAEMTAVGGAFPRLEVEEGLGERIVLCEGPPAVVRMASPVVQRLWQWLDTHGMAPADAIVRGAARPDGGAN